MHILHVTRTNDADSRYGIIKSMLPVVEAMQVKGHKVEIFDRHKASLVRMNTLELWLERNYLKRMKRKFRPEGEFAWQVLSERVTVGWRAAKYAGQNHVSHVHCHDALMGYQYYYFAKFYRATKKWGFTVHAFGRFVKLRMGLKSSDDSIGYLKLQEVKASKKSKWIVFPTKSGMTRFNEEMQTISPALSWHVVPHSVQVVLSDRNSAREKLGIPEGEKLLIAVGQLIPMKRFDLLLRSVAMIQEKIRPRVIILGEGPEKATLHDLAKKSGVNNFEIRVTDHIDDYLSAADIYVSTSSTESFGMANCEALVAGIPLVCSAVDAVPEVVKDGAVLTSDDPAEIGKAIFKVLNDSAVREKLRKNAREITASWPTPTQVAGTMEKIYLNS